MGEQCNVSHSDVIIIIGINHSCRERQRIAAETRVEKRNNLRRRRYVNACLAIARYSNKRTVWQK